MRVSELARMTGVASAIRWYEARGVLPPAARHRNGYRRYGESDIARVRLVVALRRLGLAPHEAGLLAQRCLDHVGTSTDVEDVLSRQLAAIRRQRDDLDRLESELLDFAMTFAAAGRTTRRTPVISSPIRVLFVCTHNSARSQIAEAMVERLGGIEFEAHSAGTEVTRVNPFAIAALAEQGIDWSGRRSKSITEFLGEDFDYVITVCDRARETCPVLPGSLNTLHWGLDDPSEVQGSDEEKAAAFRRTLIDISARLRPFVEIARRAARRSSVPGA